MRQEAFKQYLMTTKGRGNKPYAESTADERVRCCKTIERLFGVDLDVIAKNAIDRAVLRGHVQNLSKSNVNTFCHALASYYKFAE